MLYTTDIFIFKIINLNAVEQNLRVILGPGLRIPQNMNFSVNQNSRSKGDADIGLLVACKVQLSSEVIKWKTENLRLVKELDKALDRTDNLEGTVTQLVDRTKELEEQLARAEKDNLLLKHRNAAMNEEKNTLVKRLSSGFDKYHSFPAERSRCFPREGWGGGPPVEDYLQVSQSLLNRMKLEMQQFREMGGQSKSPAKNSALQVDGCLKECSTEEVEKDVADLISKTQSIKQYLFNQRRKLQTIFSVVSDADKTQVSPNNHQGTRSPSHAANLSSRAKDATDSPDDALCNLCPSQRSIKQPAQRDVAPAPTTPGAPSELQAQCPSDHKICPICEESFSEKPQKVFEEHVMNHLERESVSFLDQYVVL